MKKPKEFFSWCMQMQMNGGAKNDLWRLAGHTYASYNDDIGEYTDVMPSTPVSLETLPDNEGYLLTTISGSQYLLTYCRYPERKEEYLAEIRQAIEANSWGRH